MRQRYFRDLERWPEAVALAVRPRPGLEGGAQRLQYGGRNHPVSLNGGVC